MKPLDFKSWDEFFDYFCSLDLNNKKRGTDFEKFCKAYYQETGLYKNVWLLNEVPILIKESLGLLGIDLGVDLVLENYQSDFTAVQCKFHQDQNQSILFKELTHLFTHGKKAAHKIVFTNCKNLSFNAKETAEREKGFSFSGLSNLNKISFGHFTNILNRLSHKSVKKLKELKPRPYQRQAIKKIKKGFEVADKGQAIMACGTGKSLLGLWVSEALSSNQNLVLVPSLALIKQIKNTWNESKKDKTRPYLLVCSAKDTIEKSNACNFMKETDSSVVLIHDIDARVTTDVSGVEQFLLNNDSRDIFCTYQSFHIVKQAMINTGKSFDLTIYDEAHKTAGKKADAKFRSSLDNSLSLGKRLFMTATPKILSKKLKQDIMDGGFDPSELVSGMDDEKVYGKTLYELTFKDAIKKKIICNFQLIIPALTAKVLRDKIEHRVYVELLNKKFTMEVIANCIFLDEMMKKHGAHHVFTFHGSVEKSEELARCFKEVTGYNGSINSINGNQSMSKRDEIMKEYEESKTAILCNCRVLTEGVDVPDTDMVMFFDPKSSEIDIIQAIGRALRRSKSNPNKVATVIIPFFHNPEEGNLEESIAKSKYKYIRLMVNKIRNYNEVINAEINALRIEDGLHKISFGGSSKLFSIESLVEHGQPYLDDIRKSIYEIVIGNKNNCFYLVYFDSGFKGNKKWQAWHKPPTGSRKYISRFLTEKEAAMAVDVKNIEECGDNTKLNFPELIVAYKKDMKNVKKGFNNTKLNFPELIVAYKKDMKNVKSYIYKRIPQKGSELKC